MNWCSFAFRVCTPFSVSPYRAFASRPTAQATPAAAIRSPSYVASTNTRASYVSPVFIRMDATAVPFRTTPAARSSRWPKRTGTFASAAISCRIPSATFGSNTHIVGRPVETASGSSPPWPWFPIAPRFAYSSRVSCTHAAGFA